MLGVLRTLLPGAAFAQTLPTATSHWPLDSSGTVLGEGSDFVFLGGPETGLGPLRSDGTSIGLDGTNDYLSASHSAAYAFNTFTLMGYSQPDSTPSSGNRVIISKVPTSGHAHEISVEQRNVGGVPKLAAYISDSTGAAQWIGGPAGVVTIPHGEAFQWAVVVLGGSHAELWYNSVGGSWTLGGSIDVADIGLSANDGAWQLGAYQGSAFFDGVVDDFRFWANVALTRLQLGLLDPPVTIMHGGAGAGDALVRPSYALAVGQDAHPSGAIWWNPTGGNDGNNGTTKALAKKTLSAAEGALPGSNRTIIVTGGTHALGGGISPGANNYTMMAEQGATVILDTEPAFAAYRTAPNNLWEQSGVYWRTKTGGQFSQQNLHGLWFEGSGANQTAWSIRHESSDNLNNSASSNYAGPTARVNADGRIYLRFDKPSTAVVTSDWPSYQPGTSGGVWTYPSANPNNTALYIRARNTGDRSITLNGRSGLTFKDLNWIGRFTWLGVQSASSNITFTRNTVIGAMFGILRNASLSSFTLSGCKLFHGYLDMYCWNDLKGLGGATGVGNNTWDDNSIVGGSASGNSNWLLTDNLFVGWFDFITGRGIENCRVYYNWFENGRDDHIQSDINGWNGYRDAYNVYDNNPMIASNEAGPDGATSNDMQIHHNVQWQFMPRIWTKGGRPGPHVQTSWHFMSGASTRRYIWKHYNNTIIISTGLLDGNAIHIGHIGNEANNTTATKHEVYNNIFMTWGDELWNNRDGANLDPVLRSLKLDGFSNELFDYNDYRRVLTYSPSVSPLIIDCYDRATRVGGPYTFSSISALQGSGANLVNHEANGTDLQNTNVSLANMKTTAANPFVNFDPHGKVFDMHVKGGDQAKTGAKNLSATGWDGASGITANSERGAYGGGNTHVGPRSAVLNY